MVGDCLPSHIVIETSTYAYCGSGYKSCGPDPILLTTCGFRQWPSSTSDLAFRTPIPISRAMAFQSNVINSQPQVTITQYTVSSGSSDWSTSVCDCCEDCGICLCASFIPCILACKVAQDSDENCCLPCLPGAMVALRTSMRHRYNIGGSVCNDWLVMACIPLCGLCQMAREQKTRGR